MEALENQRRRAKQFNSAVQGDMRHYRTTYAVLSHSKGYPKAYVVRAKRRLETVAEIAALTQGIVEKLNDPTL